jgi:uncharacterized protein YcfJ
MKNKIIAAVAVIALGALVATALASAGTEDRTNTTAQPAAATPAQTATHVRREDRREDRAARREDRRGDRRATVPAASAVPAVTPHDNGAREEDRSGRDASGHGGHGRDHAEDDGIAEAEHHGEVEAEHHGGHGHDD